MLGNHLQARIPGLAVSYRMRTCTGQIILKGKTLGFKAIFVLVRMLVSLFSKPSVDVEEQLQQTFDLLEYANKAVNLSVAAANLFFYTVNRLYTVFYPV